MIYLVQTNYRINANLKAKMSQKIEIF